MQSQNQPNINGININIRQKLTDRSNGQTQAQYPNQNQTQGFSFIGNRDMDGKKNGFGIQKWKDGSKYKGNYVRDQAKGWGIFYHADGDVYKGLWRIYT